MNAFLVNGALITEENDISDMLANHFEALGTPTVSLNSDNEFANSISTHIQNIFQHCIKDLTGALNEALTYEKVASVCSNLKPGVSGVSLDFILLILLISKVGNIQKACLSLKSGFFHYFIGL